MTVKSTHKDALPLTANAVATFDELRSAANQNPPLDSEDAASAMLEKESGKGAPHKSYHDA